MKHKGFLFPHKDWFDIRIEKGTNHELDLQKAKELHSKFWRKDKVL